MKYCFLSEGSRSVEVLEGDTRQSGGAEAQVAHLATAFARLDHEVDLIFGSGQKKSAPRVIQGVRCIDAFPSWSHPSTLMKFWERLQESNPDLIYARIPSDFLWLVRLYTQRNPRSKFIYALSNDRTCNPWHTYPPSKGRWFHNLLYALWLPTVDLLAIQHEGQAQILKPYIKGRLGLIPNLVRSVQSEPRRFEETTIDVIWITLIRPQKQLSILLDIAEQLPTLRFVVVGGFGRESNRSGLESRMKGMKNLRYVGPRTFEDVIQLLNSSRVLVNTSSWEGFPNTMLEAWSVGVPVVSLQIDPGGVISREGLGRVSGTPDQMVRDIANLVEEPSLNYEMGKRGQEYVRRTHSIEAVCQAFEQILPGFQVQNNTARERTR